MQEKTGNKKTSGQNSPTSRNTQPNSTINPHRLHTQKENCVRFVEDLITLKESETKNIQDQFLRADAKEKVAVIYNAWSILKRHLFNDVTNTSN